MLQRLVSFVCCLSLIFVYLLPVSSVQGQTTSTDEGFDPNLILNDDDLFNVTAFSYDQLVSFLRAKGTLAATKAKDTDGQEKPIPQIIWRVATTYKMNPKYLVALLQKEQSLVEDPSPRPGQFDWATGYAVCDACQKDDPRIQEFKGFASQLEWAAKQHREKYLIQLLSRGITIGGQGVGKSMVIDGQNITPVNNATAMLYTYTPHIHGNLNLWRIWNRWFHLSFPDGSIVRGQSSGKTYLIRFGLKRPFASNAVVLSMTDEKKILSAKDEDLEAYPTGTIIRFPQYALLQTPDHKRYLIVGDSKRAIQNMDVFQKFGFNEDEVQDVSPEDIVSYEDGAPITDKTAFPQGVLVKTKDHPGVWYVEDGVRHALVDGVFLGLYFEGRQIKTIKPEILTSYIEGEPYQLHDGELVRTPQAASVYVVENSILRPIPSADIFETTGWKWKNVITVPPSVLALHVAGEPFIPSSL